MIWYLKILRTTVVILQSVLLKSKAKAIFESSLRENEVLNFFLDWLRLNGLLMRGKMLIKLPVFI